MAMRFVFAVLVAMALTITWQTAVLADRTGDHASGCVNENGTLGAAEERGGSGGDGQRCK